MKWCYLFLVIRLTLADEVTTRANIVFVSRIPMALADSIELIEVSVHFPKPLDIDWSAFKKFLKILKDMEIHAWRETQWVYCNNQKLNGIPENSQNTLTTSLQKDISEIEEERTQLIQDMKIFANSTELLNKKRTSITLLAAGATIALLLEPILEKQLAKCSPSFIFVRTQKKKCDKLQGTRTARTSSCTIYRATQMTQYTSWATKIKKQQEHMKTFWTIQMGTSEP